MAEILPIRRKTLSNQSIIILHTFFTECEGQTCLLLFFSEKKKYLIVIDALYVYYRVRWSYIRCGV